MLESKIKDQDASIELLEERVKRGKNLFLLLYIMGAVMTVFSFNLTQLGIPNAWMIMDFMIGTGLMLLIVAGYMLVCMLQLQMYVFINHKIEMKDWVRK